ncbi:hypothetical protein D3C85_1415330 [compost metagenome]
MFVLSGVHVGAHLVSGGPQSFLHILQSTAGCVGSSFTSSLLLHRLSFCANRGFARCITGACLAKCLFGETNGDLSGTLLIRHGLFPTLGADKLRGKNENPTTEVRVKMGSIITGGWSFV